MTRHVVEIRDKVGAFSMQIPELAELALVRKSPWENPIQSS